MGLYEYIKGRFKDKEKPVSRRGLGGLLKADALLHNLIAEHRIPGMAVTILRKGKTVLEKGYGYADIEKRIGVDPQQTVFRIASISKCITALALGKMVEEGIVNWDNSLYDYVPYFPNKTFDFTLRQLAAHTAGIRGYRGKEYGLNRDFSIKDSIAVFEKDPLLFEPGKGYLYNSFDFVLLSLAMQEASGIPFEEYVKEKVLLPLGMEHTFPPNEDELSFRVKRGISTAQWYTKRQKDFRQAMPVNNFYKLAGGGYLSTSKDIARMGQAILEQQLLTPETYRQLLTSQYVNGTPTYYGLGFQISQDARGRAFVGHVGNSVGAYTNFFVYPEEQLVMAMLINCADPKIQQQLDEVIVCFQK